MKTVILVCEGLTDEPIEALSGRTPLEVAKTPHMDFLAKTGAIAQGLFVPGKLRPSGDVAAMSILGFDPQEFYTGIAPLEALAMRVAQTDHTIAFRCQLVTVLDGGLVDAYAGNIPPTESTILIHALNEKLSNSRFRFFPGESFRNILMVDDAELSESLDELECAPPQSVVGQKVLKNIPKGAGASVIIEFIEAANAVLEGHEINKVRIDLRENPANAIWLWGQGKKPKMPTFKQRFNLDGGLVSGSISVQGLAESLGLEQFKNIEDAIDKKDFIFVYHALSEGRRMDLTSKIKVIEEFDAAVVGPVVKKIQNTAHRLCITTDALWPLSKKNPVHGHVPVLFEGGGVVAGKSFVFNEKNALQSKQVFNEGYEMMGFLLK